MADLPISALQQTVELAIESNETDDPEASVRAMVQNQLGDDPLPEGLEIVDWIAALTESRIRAALGAASGEKAWFKSESKGYELGKVLAQHLSSVVGTPLAKSVEQMRNFTHPSLP